MCCNARTNRHTGVIRSLWAGDTAGSVMVVSVPRQETLVVPESPMVRVATFLAPFTW